MRKHSFFFLVCSYCDSLKILKTGQPKNNWSFQVVEHDAHSPQLFLACKNAVLKSAFDQGMVPLYTFFAPLRTPFLATYYACPGQTASAIPLTSSNFFLISSYPSAFPSACDANPHCGLTQTVSRASSLVCPRPLAMKSAASLIRAIISSLFSSLGNLEVTTPRTTFLFFGRWVRGSKPPARGVSYSR